MGPGSGDLYTPPSAFQVLGFNITVFQPNDGIILYDSNLAPQKVQQALPLIALAMTMALITAAVLAQARGSRGVAI